MRVCIFLLFVYSFANFLFASPYEDFVDDMGRPLELERVPDFPPIKKFCKKCNEKCYVNFPRELKIDASKTLLNAAKVLLWQIEPPIHNSCRYIWKNDSLWRTERLKEWSENYFYKSIVSKGYTSNEFLDSYSEYMERFEFLYYWFNLCCDVYVRWLKKEIKETKNQIERAKNDGSSQSDIEYLQRGLASCEKKLIEIPNKFSESIKSLELEFDKIAYKFYKKYAGCIATHKDSNALYEKGRLAFDRGDTLEFVNDIFMLIETGQSLSPEINLELGKAYNDANLYNQAIKILSESIQKNPELKEAYYERAVAYFEKGNLQLALSDYLNYGKRPHLLKDINYQHFTFSLGIGLGCIKGGFDSATHFVPSLFSTAYGLGKGLWAFAADPIEVSKELVEEAIQCVDYIRKNLTPELLTTLVPELKECIQTWDQLEEETKGYHIGYVIGRYGVDALICGSSVRAVCLYKNLKKANAILSLETALSSPANTEALAKASEDFFLMRSQYKKQCKIHLGRQEKHIPGANNFVAGKGELTISVEHLEKLASSKLGEGVPTRFSFGESGYKETVEFDEIIGFHIDLKTEKRFSTSVGEIHYDKSGNYHVVPVDPKKIQRLLKKSHIYE